MFVCLHIKRGLCDELLLKYDVRLLFSTIREVVVEHLGVWVNS
jgi:hypothetical protein